jgi:hypothetical protein
VVTWIVIVVVGIALIVLVLASWPVLGRLAGLQRAAVRLQRRQEQAMRLQQGAAVLEQSIAALRERAEHAQQQIAVIKAGGGAQPGTRSTLER